MGRVERRDRSGVRMRISRLETFSAQAVLTRVTTDDGTQGWGQTSTYHANISATVFHRQVAP